MYKQRAFTLVELVIVIVVIGVLSFIVAPRFMLLSERAENSTVTATAAAFKESAKMASLRWHTLGGPTDEAVDLDADPNTTDDRVCFKPDNPNPQSVTCPITDDFLLTVDECGGLFLALLVNTTFPADVLANEGKCVFVYDSDNPSAPGSGHRLDFDANKLATDIPRFEYDPENGNVTTVLAD